MFQPQKTAFQHLNRQRKYIIKRGSSPTKQTQIGLIEVGTMQEQGKFFCFYNLEQTKQHNQPNHLRHKQMVIIIILLQLLQQHLDRFPIQLAPIIPRNK